MSAQNASGQPERTELDGPVALSLLPGGALSIRVTHEGVAREVVAGGYNAYRLLAMLGMFLDNGGPALLSRRARRINLSAERRASVAIGTDGAMRMNIGEKP